MRRLKVISGEECIKILCKHFEFQVLRRKGSHVSLSRDAPLGRIGVVVPVHDELKIGTLKSILKMAMISEDEFSRLL